MAQRLQASRTGDDTLAKISQNDTIQSMHETFKYATKDFVFPGIIVYFYFYYGCPRTYQNTEVELGLSQVHVWQ